MSCFSVIFLTYSLLALRFARLIYAGYKVDNANNSVVYTATGTDWRTYSSSTRNLTLETSNGSILVDSSKCYHENYALGACNTENNCQISFPFTGSGIAVHVLQAGFQGVNASIAIDGGQSVTTTLQPPAPPTYQTPNVILFNLQSLPSSVHTATINVLDYDDGSTSFYFDFAHIDESLVDVPAITSPLASPVAQSSLLTSSVASTSGIVTATSSSSLATASSFGGMPGTTSASPPFTPSPSQSLDLGAVIGGTCGGFAAVVVITAAVVLLKKRQFRHARLQESRKPDPFLASAVTGYNCSVLSPPPAHPPLDEKARQRLAARNAVAYYFRGLADSESSDFHIHSDPGEAGQPIADPGQRTTNSLSHDDLVIIDARREDGSVIDIRGSRTHTATSLTIVANSVPPPIYQSLESRDSNNPGTAF